MPEIQVARGQRVCLAFPVPGVEQAVAVLDRALDDGASLGEIYIQLAGAAPSGVVMSGPDGKPMASSIPIFVIAWQHRKECPDQEPDDESEEEAPAPPEETPLPGDASDATRQLRAGVARRGPIPRDEDGPDIDLLDDHFTTDLIDIDEARAKAKAVLRGTKPSVRPRRTHNEEVARLLGDFGGEGERDETPGPSERPDDPPSGPGSSEGCPAPESG